MKRIYLNCLAVLVIAATLMAAISGCTESDEYENSADDLYAAISWYEDILENAQEEAEGEQKFVVVIPAGCGAELFYGADFLCNEMSKYVADDVEVVYDSDPEVSDDITEILVGATSRHESVKYLKSLRAGDYGYTFADGSVIIAAHSEELCIKAIEEFVSALSKEEIVPFRISKLEPYEKRESYAISEIKLCDFPICEYDIVYPSENSMSERELAGILRDKLIEYGGYALRVISDKQCTDATRAICVGKTALSSASAAEGKVSVSLDANKNIELLADKNAGIHLAIEKLVDLVKQSEQDGKCNVVLGDTKMYSYNAEGISVYIMKKKTSVADETELTKLIQDVQKSSVALIGELSESAERELCSHISAKPLGESGYYYVGEKCISANSEQIGSGELITLVIERSDGKHFVLVGAFCGGGANDSFLGRLNEECKKYADMPLVVIHDMGEGFDESFAEANKHLSSAIDTDGVYFSRNTFAFRSSVTEEISDGASANVFELDFYYS